MNKQISKREFVVLMAGLMAVDALAVDIMLPAFPAIGQALGIANPNDRSLILTAFLMGFGPPQLICGPLADRFGRRALILGGLAAYIAMSFAAALAPSFAAMLVARFLQGAGAAAVRVAMMAAVRDRFSGQAMVDIMSLVLAIFLLVPIVCPTIGQLLLFFGSWQLIFVFIALFASVFALWSALRLPESLRPTDRRSLDFGVVADGFRIVLGDRRAFFYGIVGAFMYGIISNLLNTSQQIYVEIFHLGAWFPVAFAFTTVVASIANLFMSRITRFFGMRRVAHASVLLIVMTSAIFAVMSLAGPPTLWAFYVMLMVVFPCVVATFTTTSALAMEPLGEVAGTASSVFGAVSTVGGALFGVATAQLYDGTVTPVLWANCIMGICTLACFVIAEKGRLLMQMPQDRYGLTTMISPRRTPESAGTSTTSTASSCPMTRG